MSEFRMTRPWGINGTIRPLALVPISVWQKFRSMPRRKKGVLAFLVFLVVTTLSLSNTWTGAGQAIAGNCFVRAQDWHLQSGSVPLTVAKVRFGATICLDNGVLSGVSPFLEGGVQGAGTPAGISWDNQGSWVVRSTDHYVHIQGRATMKMCLVKYIPVCSLTDTETFDLYYTNTYGPYAPGVIANAITARSVTRDMMGHTASTTRFIRE